MPSALSVSIAQSLFIAKLKTSIPLYTTAISPATVIAAGATGLDSLAGPSYTVLVALRKAYADAIRNTTLFVLAAAVAALPFACGMQWLNIKKVAEERRNTKTEIIAQASGEP